MSNPKVVFILAANYSGSHLLAQLLAAHSHCAGVGELHNYRKFRDRGSRSGNVENDYLAHPAFQGLEQLPVIHWHRTVWQHLRTQQPQLSHLIDNSKRPEWARRFPAIEDYTVHLLRDPRALVARWLRTYDGPDAQRAQRRRVVLRRPWALPATRDGIGIYVEKWLIANEAISRFARRRARASLITYRDLAMTTATALQRLMPTLDLEFEPEQLDYGAAGGHLGTRKRDYQEAAARSEIHFDLRWRDELTVEEQTRIATHPGVRRYLAQLDLVMTGDGLTRPD